MDIAIAGLGAYAEGVENCLKSGINVVYYIDNNIYKREQGRNGKKVYSYYQCDIHIVRYVIIAIIEFEDMRNILLERGFCKEQILCFFEPNFKLNKYESVFWVEESRQFQIQCRLNDLNGKIRRLADENKLSHEHYIYEIADRLMKQEINLPKVCSVEETCQKILDDKVSVSRYGDGEFEIIFGKAKDVYQGDDAVLAERLKEILLSNLNNHIVALADDYGCMEGLREENKNVIRKYMTEEKRKQHYAYLDMDKQYYNAYISRPYVIYPHEKREEARQRFDNLKRIWESEDILIVEGDKTRMGVGNDLFSNARSIRRIIAPNIDAFRVYDEIVETVRKYGSNKLILAALGPTATVLAYDLAREGYWALDIGHLDLEYEWFLKGKGYSYIPNKYNNEVMGDDEVVDIYDPEYETSICEKIGL